MEQVVVVDEDAEDGLAARQDGRVYPVGRALRATFDADNHDSLGSDLTGLMIDLSRVPDEAAERVAPAQLAGANSVRSPALPCAVEGPQASPWWTRLGALLGRH